MKNIAISSCFINKCRYDGTDFRLEVIDEFLEELEANDVLVLTVCPEVLGGLSTPRACAEISGKKVITKTGEDVTRQFINGSKKTLELLLNNEVSLAILKQNSPSCGCGKIYDGTFSGNKISGNGITSQLLLDNNIRVFTEEDIIDCKKIKVIFDEIERN